MAEASPFGGALDQARDVGDHEPTVASEDAEVRRERGERIVRDLGPRGGQRAEERRLAGVRKPDETEVRDGVELELEGTLLALLAGLRHPGDAVLRPGEPCVPSSAAPASGDDRARSLSDEVGDQIAVLANDRSVGDRHDEVVAGRSGPVVARSRPSVLRAEVRPVGDVGEIVLPRRDLQHHGAPGTAVTAVRTAARLVRLAQERGASRAALAAPRERRHLVDEGHGPIVVEIREGSARWGS